MEALPVTGGLDPAEVDLGRAHALDTKETHRVPVSTRSSPEHSGGSNRKRFIVETRMHAEFSDARGVTS